MREEFIKYTIEDIVNEQLYEKQIIDESTYEIVSKKLQKLLYNQNSEEG